MSEKFKAYITKFALTKGILVGNAQFIYPDNKDSIFVEVEGGCYHYEKGNWHLEKQDAIKKAHEMRLEEIFKLRMKVKELESKIDRLESMKFRGKQ
jgi:hypothetical protein